MIQCFLYQYIFFINFNREIIKMYQNKICYEHRINAAIKSISTALCIFGNNFCFCYYTICLYLTE